MTRPAKSTCAQGRRGAPAAPRHRPRASPRKGIGHAHSLVLAGALALFVALPGHAASDAPEQQAVDAATALVDAAEHLDAINIVEAAIGAIEERSSRYNLELARPLLVLGDALAGVGDHEGAFGAYDRALHITRVSLGLHHPDQVQVVYREAALLAKEGQYAKANRRHEYAYGILLRSHGGDDPALLPGLFVLADWYMANFNIFSARELYDHAAKVAATRLTIDHPARIRALRSIAATYRSERFPPYYTRRSESPATPGSYAGFQYRPSGSSINRFAKGELALIEVIKLIQANDAAHDQDRKVAEAMLELGDWFLMFDKHRRALALYQHVWELLQPTPALLAQTFAEPTPLYLPLPRDPQKPERATPVTARKGVVELSIDINTRGMVSRIDTLHSEPPELMDFKVRRAVKRARYRPAFDGDTPKATEDVRVKHTFVYYPTAQSAGTADDGSSSVANPATIRSAGQADAGDAAGTDRGRG